MPATVSLPKTEIRGAKADIAPPKPLPAAAPLNDFGVRAALIPAFGIAIPNLTGLLAPFPVSTTAHWLSYPWFILVSFLIWHGNRFFLIQQRKHYDWFDHPLRKVCLLLFANVFYTAPLTIGMLLAWYAVAGLSPDWNAIRTATLACVICVVFITHMYETVYLIQQRESDLLNFEKLERARAQAELAALKAQLDPHFLFNSLNTLSWLIQRDAVKALQFNESLADVCRYILRNKDRDLVLLEEELDFLRRYHELLRLRFQGGIELDLPAGEWRGDRSLVLPISLQLLLENAVKHNEFTAARPLRVSVAVRGDALMVGNEKRPRAQVRETARIGLKNLDERCRLVFGRGIEVSDDGAAFSVRLPMKPVA
ncbi:MAG: histidine kinase [Bryobacteraceae bacterium]|nr:histidine kinase [Bryobacteraceae bacterium]